jgi:hypothetical protein
MPHPHVLQLIMDSLRYWVWRCTSTASASTSRTLARELYDVDRWRVLRHHPPGSRALPGQADRRAVGRGRGRLPGRQFPVLWAEWNGKYRDTCATSGGRRGSRVRLPAHRLSDLYETTAGAVASINFVTATTASRCATWSPTTQAQRGQRRGQPRRHRRQPVLELRRRGPTDDPPSTSCASARSATSWPRSCSPRACR